MNRLLRRLRTTLLLLCPLLFLGCSTMGGPTGRTLRVGITPDYPPIAFLQGDQIVGVEADLAQLIADDLNRPIEFVQLRFRELVPALLDGRIDLVMSGMSVTDARRLRVVFCDPYLQTGLMTLMRQRDSLLYNSPLTIMEAVANVGAKGGTTAEEFVVKNFRNARRMTYKLPEDAARDLIRNKIDLFVHDGPAVAWLVSENESELTALLQPLTADALAWAVRRDNPDLQATLNALLARLKQSGQLDHVLNFWMPYRKNL